MAQLVARFHGMEEVGGSNPPSSTENVDIRFRMSIFCCMSGGDADGWGYRTFRVAGGVTFRLCGGGKSVLKLVGANLKDGQNVLVLW